MEVGKRKPPSWEGIGLWLVKKPPSWEAIGLRLGRHLGTWSATLVMELMTELAICGRASEQEDSDTDLG